MPKSGLPKLGKCDLSEEKWGWTDGRCQNQAFRSLENAILIEKSRGGQMGDARIWLSEAWEMRYFSRKLRVDRWAVPESGLPKLGKCDNSREKWGYTDGRCQNLAFRNLKNAIFLETSGGGQMGDAKIWLSKTREMR